MKTAYEVALEKLEAREPIPRITDPLGSGWEQPDRHAIEIDNDFALMTKTVFEQLAEYSCSFPSGTYLGKMWKRHAGFRNPSRKGEWYLCWYNAFINDGKDITIKYRRILLSDGDLPHE